jgi:hypothetical protein
MGFDPSTSEESHGPFRHAGSQNRRQGQFLTRTAIWAAGWSPGLINPAKRSSESEFDSGGHVAFRRSAPHAALNTGRHLPRLCFSGDAPLPEIAPFDSA